MEFTARQKFSAMNDKHENLKDCEGLRIHPVASLTYQYTDSKDKEHTVLVVGIMATFGEICTVLPVSGSV